MMNHVSEPVDSNAIEHTHPDSRIARRANGRELTLPMADRVAKGIATGVAVSTVTWTGRNIIGAMTRNPLIMFGLGLTAGYLAHKYRKELVASATKAAEQTKDFVLRQQENLRDLVAEAREAEE